MTRAVLLLALVACTADRRPQFRPAANSSPRDGGTLRYATNAPVRTLDPTIEYDDVSHTVVHALFDTLVDYASNGVDLVPRLAAQWARSSDGLVYTFTLRDATFSDGTPIVAGD